VAQLVVRNLENEVKLRLRTRAQQHGRSMEEEVRAILRSAVAKTSGPAQGLGSAIAARFRHAGLTVALPEFHGEAVQPADFDPPSPGRRRTS
jgi:plasmid stability protein